MFLCSSIFLTAQNEIPPVDRIEYQKWLNDHPYSNPAINDPVEIKKIPKKDRPDLAMEQEFLMTLDPALGYPPREKLVNVYKALKFYEEDPMRLAPGSTELPWEERGPITVGGRTRALIFDPNDPNDLKVFAGGVAGGLWYTNDITDSNEPWVAIDDFWTNIAVGSMAYNPVNTLEMYVGTGEGYFNVDAVRGAGIWKTSDGGATWSQLSSTNNSDFYYVQEIIVHPVTQDIYAATRSGLRRSQDGGTSWTKVLGSGAGATSNRASDLALGADNTIYVTLGISNSDGIYKSTTGDNGDWTKLNVVGSGFPDSGIKRIEIATAPSDANVIYAIAQGSGNAIEGLYRSDDKGVNWVSLTLPDDADPGIPSNDFSRGQSWYDLSAAVDPSDAATVYVGGIDLFRSEDSGTTWTQISHWYGGFGFPYVHADQHALAFRPGSSTELISGNDGGVFYTNNANNTSGDPTWLERNNNYNVTQFYSCAIHPTAAQNEYIGGTQDNGTHQLLDPGLNVSDEVTGGDGAFCFIDQTEGNIQISSYVNNTYYLTQNNWNTSTTILDESTGKFINPADYDDNLNILYTAKNSTEIKRISGIGGTIVVDDVSIAGLGSTASHLRVSQYTTTSTTLFIGTGSGVILKVEDADGTPTITDLDANDDLPVGNISCIELGSNEDEILVTFSNYGIVSVWYTSDGGITWNDKEGDLPNMPVRWALFNPNDNVEVILATEMGVWSTGNLGSASPAWVPSNNGLANVRVDMLQYRSSDQQVIAGTHGRGLYTSTFSAFDDDASVVEIVSPPSVVCDSIINPSVRIKNSGIQTLTSLVIDLEIDDVIVETINYVGSLAPASDTIIDFVSTSIGVGFHTIDVIASLPNGNPDQNPINDELNGNVTRQLTELVPQLVDFEGLSDMPPPNWTLSNPDGGITWEIFQSNVSFDCVPSDLGTMRFFHYSSQGAKDELISPVYNFDIGHANYKLDFDYAYAQRPTSTDDRLEVLISTDCGNNWISLFDKSGTDLSTAPSVSFFYVPQCADFIRETIDLSAYENEEYFQLMFRSTNENGNNLYIDNINIYGDIAGCTDPTAFNYNPAAVVDNGTCAYCDIQVEILAESDSCYNTSDIKLFSNVTSANFSNFVYSWTDGEGNSLGFVDTLFNESSGEKRLFVFDSGFQCNNSDTAIVAEPGIVSIVAGAQGVCDANTNTYTQDIIVTYNNPNSLNLVVNGMSLASTGSPQTIILSGLTADSNPVDVNVHLEGEPGCNLEELALFTAPPSCDFNCENLTVSISGNTSYCFSTGTILSANQTGGVGTITYDWSGPGGFASNSLSIIAFDEGLYSVIVTDDNCSENASITIDSYGITQLTAGTQSSCNPGTSTYDQEIIVTFDEFPGMENFDIVVNGNSFPIVSSPQSVTLTGLNADSNPVDVNAHLSNDAACDISETSLFTAPAPCSVNCATDLIFVLSGADFCVQSGGNITLILISSNPPVSYSWTGPNGFTSNQQNLSGLEEGEYTVTVTDAFCQKEESITINAYGITSLSAGTQTSCDLLTNLYEQEVILNFVNHPDLLTWNVNLDGDEYGVVSPSMIINKTDLFADGNPVSVNAFLTNDPGCFVDGINLFTAPAQCTDCLESNFVASPTGLFEEQTTSTTILKWDHYSDATSGCLISSQRLDGQGNNIGGPINFAITGPAKLSPDANGHNKSAPYEADYEHTRYNQNTFPNGNLASWIPGEPYKWRLRCACIIDESLPFPNRVFVQNLHLSPWSVWDNFTNLSLPNPVAYESKETVEEPFTDNKLELIPNPTQGSFILYYNSSYPQISRLVISDLYGKSVFEQGLESQKGENFFQVDLNAISNGIYLVQVYTDDLVLSERLLKAGE